MDSLVGRISRNKYLKYNDDIDNILANISNNFEELAKKIEEIKDGLESLKEDNSDLDKLE
ncbi:MAG: hypothetical protein LBT51_04625 [Fusobacteriaceae bacterium]|jgi:archaellum component FlaC|nr:hypothetical protein [Fusobacteriaceae bacterium]